MGKWKTIASKEVFRNKWLSLEVDEVTRPDGTPGQYSVVNSGDVVAIVACNNLNELYLIRLHRYPSLSYSWEISKGRTDKEEPQVAAARELQEETGLVAEKLTAIGHCYPLNGLARETTYVYLAQGLKQTEIQDQATEGIIELKAFSFQEIEKMIFNNEILDGQTISALYKVKLYLEQNHE
jgi:8-oxo-dGTP pyrophosphatase MutT (NUDIX family)